MAKERDITKEELLAEFERKEHTSFKLSNSQIKQLLIMFMNLSKEGQELIIDIL